MLSTIAAPLIADRAQEDLTYTVPTLSESLRPIYEIGREHRLESMLRDSFEQVVVPARDRLAAIFAGKEIAGFPNFFHTGALRHADNLIFRPLVDRLIQSRGEPINIIEFACGTFFGSDFHYGSPWLARRIKATFRDLVDITVTDLKPDPAVVPTHEHNMLLFYTTENGTTYLQKEKVTSKKAHLSPCFKLADNAPGQIKACPTEFADMLPYEPELNEWFRTSVLEMRRMKGPGKAFISSEMNSQLESAMFNLRFQGGVDFKDLANWKGKKFDFVYGRHLNPLSQNKVKAAFIIASTERSLRQVMNPGATGLLHYHDDRIRSDQIHKFQTN